ncbi:LANO_0F12288g1_1 [Lachancea nothofagi CBS 11611]|uniref:LANO_0F12288g1_1 n=1 Tax=Lachancea nothofagi CBS 11611 TaxID=1266666 RepID=A0A1G4KBA1_9SACH|nr:LANO_0F12288g1_1 [Lachancea nothofagi CBS 11611]
MSTITKETAPQKKALQTSVRITDDDLYRHSSQYRLWSFTPDSISQIREEINVRATAKVHQDLKVFLESHPELSSEERGAIESKAIPVSTQEELLLIGYFARMILSFAGKMNLPTEVAATAVSFFRKFFLSNSVMEFAPKEMFHTALFFACKSENYFIGVESFAKKAKTTTDAVLKHEFKLLESLNFTLMNHHPYKALHGFFLDIQSVLSGKVDLNYMGQVYTNCKKAISDALLTDAVYFFSPPQITLAILLMEDEALMMRYMQLKFNLGSEIETSKDDSQSVPQADHQNSINAEKLLEVIKSCKAVISEKIIPAKEDAVRITAKLHYCQNPMSVIDRLKRQRETSSAAETPVQTPVQTPVPGDLDTKRQKT